MNDAQSTIAGLSSQDCPSGGWNGMPPELERATVADCLAHGVCGCIYGDAVKHIEQLRSQEDKLLRAAIDATWGEALEDGSVPATKKQDWIIAYARAVVDSSAHEQKADSK